MLGYDRLELAVLEYVDKSGLEFFDVEELAAELDPQEKKEDRETVLRRICGILDSCELVARKHSSDLYYVLENFFRETVFYCKPREIELEKGILIPGARFEAFHPEELYPSELEITRRHGKDIFALTLAELRYGDISDLFLMLGPAGTMDMLTAESQENYEALRRAGGLRPDLNVELEAFDFSEFYRETDFRTGDLLKFEIESWSSGRMNVSRVSRIDSPAPREVSVWIDKFESALTDVCFDYKDSLEIYEQLMYAYVYAAASGNDIRRIPGPATDLYQNMMQTISFRRDGSEWTLISNDTLEEDPVPQNVPEHHHDHTHHHHDHGCSCGHDHPQEETPFGDMSPDDFSASQGSLDSIDAILNEIHAPIHETELQAYMLDTIANGTESFDEFERIHENLVKFVFTDEGQEATYLNYIEELWEQLVDRYSHNIDSPKAPLRQRLLELTDRRIELSSIILEHKSTLSDDLKQDMVKLHKEILDTLFVLNRDAILEEEEIAELELRVGDIENEFEIISEKISAWLEQQISGK